MTQPLTSFTQQLTDSGLMSAADVQAFCEARPTDTRPSDGEQLARALINEKKLTPFQADQIFAGNGASLVLGNYVILGKLGQEGMGVVYKAQHRRMDRLVALKVLSPRITGRPESAQRFEREVQAAAKLTHPNIVKALDAELDGTRRFLVMEYVDGADLLALVRRCGKLPIRWASDFTRQAALGLDYAHHQGIVHRDIKPSNLLRDRSGTIKILDLGLARMMVADGAAELTSTGAAIGTVDYMAPEQAADSRHADARADIYSLGITLWFLLTGRLAYEGDSAMAKLLAHSESPIPSLLDARPEVPPELERIFQKMVAKQPEQRYSSMADVAADLERCLTLVSAAADEPANLVAALDEPLTETGDSTVAYQFPAAEKETMPYLSTKDMWAQVRGDADRLRTNGRRLKWGLAVLMLTVGGVAIVWQADPFGLFVRDESNPPAKQAANNPADGNNEAEAKPVEPVTKGTKDVAVVAPTPAEQKPAPTPPVTKVEPPRDTADHARQRVAELTTILDSQPQDLRALQERNKWNRQLGQWREAAADLEVLADLGAKQSSMRMQVGYIAVLGGDLERYRRTCRTMIEQFSDSDNLEDLERVCKAPLLVAGEFKIADLPLERFEKMIKPEEPDKGPTYWACTTRAYIAVRAGQPAEALDWLAKRTIGEYAQHLYGYQQLVKAQALHQLGRSEEAREAFDTAVSKMPAELLQQLDGPHDPDRLILESSTHGDWLIMALLKRQAEAVLKMPPSKPE